MTLLSALSYLNLSYFKNSTEPRKDLFAYTNLIKCGVCGCAITAEIKKEKYVYYHCSGYKGNCNQPYVREEVIDEKIASLLDSFSITDSVQEMILSGMRESFKDKIRVSLSKKLRSEVVEMNLRTIDRAYEEAKEG